MKVYQVDEVTWYAADSPEQAQKLYLADAGEDVRDYIKEFGDPVEVSEDGMDRLTVTDVDEPGQPTHSFRQLLATAIQPGFFATSEW